MIRTYLGRLGLLLAVALIPASAPAQTPIGFEGLQGILKTDELVIVIDRLGRETPGKVAEVSTSTTRSFQAPAAALAELASLVFPGTTVVVTDRTGDRVTGRLVSITERALTIAGRDRAFVESDLAEVQARVRDTRLDGAALGFVIGFGVPALVCTSRSDPSETIPCVVGSLILGGLPGFGIGMAVDAKQARLVTVFRRTASGADARLTLAPVVGGKTLGVTATLRY